MSRPPSPSSEPAPAIMWFRDDLRLADNPALVAAADGSTPLLLVYLLDEDSRGLRKLGGAARWWLHQSLTALSSEIERLGAKLHLFCGAAGEVIPRLAAESGAASVFCARRYTAGEIAVDEDVEAQIRRTGLEFHSFDGKLGREPDEIKPKAGGWYRVYSAYWRAAQAAPPLEAPLPAPRRLKDALYRPKTLRPRSLDDLGLLPRMPDWSGGLAAAWTPGEASAQRMVERFAADGIQSYAKERDEPALKGGSRLSPHLRFGEISPRQIVSAIWTAAEARRVEDGTTKFLQEVAWRDFSYNLLFHAPRLPTESFDPKFRDFPWKPPSKKVLRAWQQGRTGYPIVDAGMRQLWQTGWMHNRVRMITASFLVKHLLADWRIGEAWFWDTLCDADPANNAVNWQWVAGTGPDAAPFFRIFNPIVQGEKFDCKGAYVRSFVPELRKLPDRWVHKPWEAPADVLADAGIELGKTYPEPIVDHAEARQRALDAFAGLRKSRHGREPRDQAG